MSEQEAVKAPPTGLRAAGELIFVKVPYTLGGILIFVAIAINFTNVVGRYLFSTAVYWAEEVLVFLIIWGVFLAGIAMVYQGSHIRMDLLSATMRSPIKEIVGGLTALLLFVCTGFVAVQSYRVVYLYAFNGGVTITAGVPLTIPHSALLVGFALMALVAVLRLPAYLSGKFE